MYVCVSTLIYIYNIILLLYYYIYKGIQVGTAMRFLQVTRFFQPLLLQISNIYKMA